MSAQDRCPDDRLAVEVDAPAFADRDRQISAHLFGWHATMTRDEYVAACKAASERTGEAIEPRPEVLAELPPEEPHAARLARAIEKAGSTDTAPEIAREDAADDAPARPSLASQLLSRSELRSLPEPEPLIADTLDKHAVMMLSGYYGTGKSFVALDWAASIATGRPWLGRTSERARVLYVLGEGAYGIHARLRSWEEHHGAAIADGWLDVLPVAAQVAGQDLGEVVALVGARGYGLVVIDTLARAAVGLEENSARDMGVFVAALDEIRRATDNGSVLVVHHSGKGDKGDSRGSSAIGGAMDVVYQVKGDGRGTLELSRTKRKEGPTEDRLSLALQERGSSVVVAEAENSGPSKRDRIAERIREELHKAGAIEPSGVYMNADELNERVGGRAADVRSVRAALLRADFIAHASRKGYALPEVTPLVGGTPGEPGATTGDGPEPLPPGWDVELDAA
ncbi:AAA family ATPase [Flexivirga sp. B27]